MGGGQKASPNWASISDFLTLGYIPGGQTAFEGVHHVLPGSRLVIDTDVKEDVWWNLPSSKESDKEERSDWDEVILIHLKESIKYRLISDVPIGLFLSGGLDSALMLALIKEVGLPDEFVAYTVGFNSESYDETQAATLLADYYKVDHKAIKMEAADIERIFSDVVYKSDNLIANPAIFANYLLSEKASKDVKAVLNGGGGDELFFGYETYKADTLAKKLEFVPQFVRGLIAAVVSAIPTDYKKLGFKYKAVKFLEGLEYEPMKRHYSWRTIFTEKDKDKLLSEGVVRHDSYKAYKDAYSLFNGDDFYESLAFADLKVWWGDMGLYQGDVMSMANSLELRMPFMDQGLVELVAKIPRKSKYDGTELKSLMKKVCQRFLPLEVLNRPKSGFHLPLAEWFAGPLKQFMLDGLSADNLSSIPQLNPKEVNKVIEDHLSKRHDNSFKIINLLVLVEWHKQFITH
jgi:asparagine synthase (glutamine-hydrolysing)